jgi:hypothetical protein
MDVVFHLRSWKGASFGTAAIAMGAACAFLAFQTDARRWSYFAAAVLLFGFGFFAVPGLALLARALSPYPALKSGPAGIEFRSVPFLSGHVPYSNISGIRALRYGAGQYVCMDLRSDESYVQSQPRLLRPALRYLSKAGHPVCIVLVAVGRGERHQDISARLRQVLDTVRQQAAPP